MAITKIPNQFYYNGGKALDAKTQPVNDINDLTTIPVKERYAGMTVTVLNNKFDEEDELIYTSPMECWLVGETTNNHWKIKSLYPFNTYADLSAATETILALFSKMLNIGTEATVIADETNDDKLTKYWVTNVDTTAKTVTWEKMNNGGGGQDLNDYLKKDIISGEDMEK